MRLITVLICCLSLAACNLTADQLITYPEETSLLEWKFRKSKKGKGGVSRKSHKEKKHKKEKKRGLFGRKKKKDRNVGTRKKSFFKRKKDKGDTKEKKKSFFKRRKDKKEKKEKKKSFFRRRKDKKHEDNEHKHKHHHKEITDELHEVIENDQKEAPSWRNPLSNIQDMATDIKNHLMEKVSRDVDSVLQEVGAREVS